MLHERQVIAALAEKLSELPAPRRDRISTQEAIQMIAPSVALFRERGDTWEEVRQALAALGFSFSRSTLVTYFKKTSSPGRRRRSGTRPGAESATTPNESQRNGVVPSVQPSPGPTDANHVGEQKLVVAAGEKSHRAVSAAPSGRTEEIENERRRAGFPSGVPLEDL